MRPPLRAILRGRRCQHRQAVLQKHADAGSVHHMPHTTMRWIILVASLASALLAPPALRSQDVVDPLAELRQRLDALERENCELKSLVTNRLRPGAAASAPNASPPSPPMMMASDGQIRSIVEEYLAQRSIEQANFESATNQQPAAAPQGT